MKNNILTSIFVLTFTIAFSQTSKYFPFPESDAVWRDSTCGVISWEMTGDTVRTFITFGGELEAIETGMTGKLSVQIVDLNGITMDRFQKGF